MLGSGAMGKAGRDDGGSRTGPPRRWDGGPVGGTCRYDDIGITDNYAEHAIMPRKVGARCAGSAFDRESSA